MKIKQGDYLEMMGGRAFEVLDGESWDGISGELTLVEVDENNNHIGKAFDYEITISSPIRDVIR
ncbi:hypothetical protein NW801_13655 [Brevibacillus laterosporus]|uniref:Uncharacterized protein n=1 Tax=Brevibacillus halotolerans TaxID=1507437 RepID=A0ABT4HYJ8_9BACL|nr:MULTISPECIES: hypothetical protein [Brevibacillus]MCR8986069.1 hypothetical protein [Brevibacillus laterosporus]MCZ0831802.1 hypothetical protein [Brevibacillus halotolerans]